MTIIHASACIFGRHGVLVRGTSGSGKSLLVRMLLDTARAQGTFGSWVADDQVRLDMAGGALIARPVEPIAGRAELRFHGIEHVPHTAAARIDLVVDLAEMPDRLPETLTVALETVPLPRTHVPSNDLGHARSIIEARLSALSD